MREFYFIVWCDGNSYPNRNDSLVAEVIYILFFLFVSACAPVGDSKQTPEKNQREIAYRCGVIVGSRFIEFKPTGDQCRQIMREFGDGDKLKPSHEEKYDHD